MFGVPKDINGIEGSAAVAASLKCYNKTVRSYHNIVQQALWDMSYGNVQDAAGDVGDAYRSFVQANPDKKVTADDWIAKNASHFTDLSPYLK